VYGAGGDQPRTEDDPVNPLTAYAQSKIDSERELASLADERFTVTCLRFATACGFSPRLRLDLVLNDFAASALATGKIVVLSDGTPWRPLIHVRDMARAIEWAAMRSAKNGEACLVLNAGSDEWNYQIRELAEAVCRQLDNIDFSVNPDAPPDRRSYRVDFSRFRKLAPEHQPKETLPSTVEELLNGLRGIGFSDPNFRESRFIRLRVLSDLRGSGKLSENLSWQN
jgi:nucleoside-diphosphate-sugar epimerase